MTKRSYHHGLTLLSYSRHTTLVSDLDLEAFASTTGVTNDTDNTGVQRNPDKSENTAPPSDKYKGIR